MNRDVPIHPSSFGRATWQTRRENMNAIDTEKVQRVDGGCREGGPVVEVPLLLESRLLTALESAARAGHDRRHHTPPAHPRLSARRLFYFP
jgi:hypothetical protein